MRIKPLFGALALASTFFIAACGSDNPISSTSTAASSSSGTTATMPGMDHTSMEPTDSTSHDTTPDATMDMGGSTDTGGSMDMGDQPPASGLAIQLGATSFAAKQQTDLTFTIVANDGSIVTDYEVEQTKELHLVLVRSDLTGYQHLHPTRSADGTWTVPVTFAQGGSYRMVADFVPVLDGVAAGRTAVTTDLTVTGPSTDTPLPAVSNTTTVDGYTVRISGELSSTAESTLNFAVTDAAGAAVTLEPYLGAFGHLVAFAQSDLAYTHVHPASANEQAGTIEFLGQVAASGAHRLFLQFAAAGEVHTAEFTIDAK